MLADRGQLTGVHQGGDGSLTALDLQLSASILDVEVYGAFGNSQDDPGFPTGLA